jgi:hypothetical protein
MELTNLYRRILQLIIDAFLLLSVLVIAARSMVY